MQADSLKKDLTDRLRQGVVDAQKAGTPLQPRWFELKSPDCLTPNTVFGTEQRYRCGFCSPSCCMKAPDCSYYRHAVPGRSHGAYHIRVRCWMVLDCACSGV